MTRRTDNQDNYHQWIIWRSTPWMQLHKAIAADDKVRIFSDRGSVIIPVKLTYLVKPGVVRTTFHQPDVFINMITGNVGDEYHFDS